MGDAFLEKAPGVDVNIDTVFTSAEYTRNFLWSAYGQLYCTYTSGNMMNGAPIDVLSDSYHCYVGWGGPIQSYYPGLLTEDAQDTENGNFQGKFSYSTKSGLDSDAGGRVSIYETVRKCWQLIENIEKVPDMSDDEKSRLRGEAYTIMASRYFDAFRNFGGLCLARKAYGVGEAFTGGRATAMETVEFIDSLIVCNGFRYAVAGYLLEYCLHGDVTVSGLIINYTVFMTFGEVTCMIFGGLSPKFTKWVGSKKMAFFWAAVICVVTSIAFFFIPMDPKYIWVMVATVILTSVGIGLYSPLLWSMYADVADYATQQNGTSSTGLIFSSGTMAQKFGSAISGALVAMLLGFAGFISGTDPATGQTVVTITNEASVQQMVWSLFSLFPAAIAAIILILLRLYPINK